uniref:Uncharacterized protein n=1 Tax=Romanomermis culicivorax TaxID=13658 RepID=A0A915HXF6_ROMCU
MINGTLPPKGSKKLLQVGQDSKKCLEVENGKGIWISTPGEARGAAEAPNPKRLPNTGNVLHNLHEMSKDVRDHKVHEKALADVMRDQCPKWKADEKTSQDYIRQLLEIAQEQNLCYPVGDAFWRRGYKQRKARTIRKSQRKSLETKVHEEHIPARELKYKVEVRSEVETDSGVPTTDSPAYQRLPNVGTVLHNLQVLASKNRDRAVSEEELTEQMMKKCPTWNVSENDGRIYVRELLQLGEGQNLCHETVKGRWRPGYKPSWRVDRSSTSTVKRTSVSSSTTPKSAETTTPPAKNVVHTTALKRWDEDSAQPIVRSTTTKEEKRSTREGRQTSTADTTTGGTTVTTTSTLTTKTSSKVTKSSKKSSQRGEKVPSGLKTKSLKSTKSPSSQKKKEELKSSPKDLKTGLGADSRQSTLSASQTPPQRSADEQGNAIKKAPVFRLNHSKNKSKTSEKCEKSPKRFFEAPTTVEDPPSKKIFGQSSPVLSRTAQPPKIGKVAAVEVENGPQAPLILRKNQLRELRTAVTDDKEVEALMGGKTKQSCCQICGFRYGSSHFGVRTILDGNTGACTYDATFSRIGGVSPYVSE